MTQMVKNPPAMWDLGLILGWEDPLEKGTDTHSSIHSYLENLHGQRSLVGNSPWGHKESDMTEKLSLTHSLHG